MPNRREKSSENSTQALFTKRGYNSEVDRYLSDRKFMRDDWLFNRAFKSYHNSVDDCCDA